MPSSPLSDASSIRNVLRGVYYRHEFARRNASIIEASDELMSLFPKTNKKRARRNSQYLSSKGLMSFTDHLINEIKGSTGRNVKKMREALTEFLDEYRILPVPKLPKMFFSYPVKIEEEEKTPASASLHIRYSYLVFEYSKLLIFESFAISDLKMKHPIFLNTVPLGETQTTWNKVINPLIEENTSKNEHLRIIVINADNSVTTIRNNLNAWVTYREFFDKADKNKNRQKRKSPRIPWDMFEKYLGAFDQGFVPESLQRDVGNKVVRQYLSPGRTWLDPSTDWKLFVKWQQESVKWVANYKLII